MNDILSIDFQQELIKKTKLSDFIDLFETPSMLFNEAGTKLYCNPLGNALLDSDQGFSSSICDLFQLIKEKNIDPFSDTYLFGGISYRKSVQKINFDDFFIWLVTIDPLEHSNSDFETFNTLNKELEMILESVHEGIYVTDEKGFTLRINKAYSEMSGISKEEVQARHVSELMHKGYFDHSLTLEVLKSKKKVSILQKIKNGNQIWLATGNPVFDNHGKLVRVVNTMFDMTELNQLKETLKAQETAFQSQRVELQALRSQVADVPGLIGNSYALKSIKSKIQRLSSIDATVLILGETGCGKNVVARGIHQLSERSSQPFIEVNCGAIPEHLLESELFGYASGAFTGANRTGKPGLIEAAHRGTIFLDEIGDMPFNLQVKLLTFLQDKKVRRVGETKSIEVDVRIIAATHKDPVQLIRENKLREDLYYRLSVVPIHMPTLRDRKDDIYILTEFFLQKYNAKYNRNVKLSKAVYLAFEDYHWPGNVRELEHLIEQLIVLADDYGLVDIRDLPLYFLSKNTFSHTQTSTLKQLVDHVELQIIKETWEELKDVNLVANRLGIHRTTLVRKANKLGFFIGDEN